MTILIAIIFLLLYWIRKQQQFIKMIEKINAEKSKEIKQADEIIHTLLETQDEKN